MRKQLNTAKEHRKDYRGAKAVDPRCRNHGGCNVCEQNRKYKDKRRKKPVEQEEDE